MGKALYRTYRSTSFDEVLGQEHVTTTLKNALKNGNINHAYLLTGPRGVGKTSVARILAHAVNDLEYRQDGSHIDIIEIDAASNRRIDEIRELRERVMIAPAAAKYKVYIIDEVHMLTREAFNALLKTLEEPPAHVIFILATTEFHKLPDTIVSRCLRFNFKPIEISTAVAHLQHIVQNEGLEIDDDALQLIAEHGDGSFRDSISQLDQLRGSAKKISRQSVEHMLGVAPRQKVVVLLDNVLSGSPHNVLDSLADLYSQGADPSLIAKQLSGLLRAEIIASKSRLARPLAMRLLKDLLEVQSAPRAKAWLELTLLDTAVQYSPQAANAAAEPLNGKQRTESKPIPSTIDLQQQSEDKAVSSDEKIMPGVAMVDKPGNAGEQDLWASVLAVIKTKNNTLYSLARMAEPQLLDDKLIISFGFAFHYKQISESSNKNLISDIVKSEYPAISSIEVKLAPKKADSAVSPGLAPKSGKEDPAFSSITNIFGGGEVLES